jgi:4'-phosphopantetheinyl transferase
MPVWHRGLLATLAGPAGLVVWHVHQADGVTPAAPTAADLADAATAADGAARLWRRGLARALVAHLAGCHPDHVRFGRSPAGAPLVTAPDGWHISLSGRGAVAVIAASRAPLGVDTERHDGAPPLPDMLTPAEVATVLALPAGDRAATWLQRWTIKEAVAKLIGHPRDITPESIETRLFGDDGFSARCGDQHAQGWTRHNDGWITSLAVRA